MRDGTLGSAWLQSSIRHIFRSFGLYRYSDDAKFTLVRHLVHFDHIERNTMGDHKCRAEFSRDNVVVEDLVSNTTGLGLVKAHAVI